MKEQGAREGLVRAVVEEGEVEGGGGEEGGELEGGEAEEVLFFYGGRERGREGAWQNVRIYIRDNMSKDSEMKQAGRPPSANLPPPPLPPYLEWEGEGGKDFR